jgi:hypothetical protein
MKITKKQSIADKFAKAFIKGDGSISLKDLISDEKEDMESVLKALLEQQNLSEEQKKQLLQVIKATKKTTRGLRDLDKLQQEAFDEAREQGKSIFQSLKAADKLKEDYEAATTKMRSRYGKIVTAFGGSEELAQVADLVFGKRVSKEERKELAEKFKVKREKKTKTKAAQGDAQQTQQQTATKKPRGRIDPVTGEFVRTDFGSQVLQQEKDPFAPVLSAISETPKIVDELVEEEPLQEKIDKIFESVGEGEGVTSVHAKLILMSAGLIKIAAEVTAILAIVTKIAARQGISDVDIDKTDKKRKTKKGWKDRLKRFGRFGRIGAVGVGGAAVVAGGGALMATGGGLYALNKGITDVGKEGMGKMSELESKYGLKTIYDKGMAVGYEVKGQKYGLNDLPQEYKDLIDAYGPGDKRSFSAREALKRIKENPERYKVLEVSASTAVPVAGATSGIPVPSTSPTQTTPELPPIRVASSMPGAIPSVETGASAEELKKYVRLKDSSINLDGLNEQMKERLAGLAKEYFNKTGQKIQINSGYRSPEEQAALFAKYGAPRAAPPGRSRHESGLAVDINSTDANKAIELGLMAKYGFTRPVRGETWHVEPIETAKRGATPDNPYKPGAPIVASNNGNEIDPKSGRAPSSGIASPPAKQAEMGTAVAAAPPRTETPGATASVTAPPAVTATPITPTPVTGTMVTQQTTAVTSAKEEMMVSAAPTVVPVPVGGQSQGAKPMPPSNAVPASTRDSESSFARALAKDFAHPSAFTTIGTV